VIPPLLPGLLLLAAAAAGEDGLPPGPAPSPAEEPTRPGEAPVPDRKSPESPEDLLRRAGTPIPSL
jgi:hypothetical protein